MSSNIIAVSSSDHQISISFDLALDLGFLNNLILITIHQAEETIPTLVYVSMSSLQNFESQIKAQAYLD